MKNINIYLMASIAICGLIIGILFGFLISPEYQRNMYEDEMGLGTADRFVDLRYVNKMIAHHRAAMLLAEQAIAKSTRPEIQGLGSDILTNEPKLIAELYGWKKAWYKDTRQVKDPVVSDLGEADDKFDLRFLNALISHHEEGIKMTKEIRMKSSRSDVLNNADAVEKFLTETFATFKQWRSDWYQIN